MTHHDNRSRFPGLSDDWVRLDGPAGTLPVDTCIAAIADYMRSPDGANLGGSFAASQASDGVVDRARASVARLVNAQPDEVVFGPSSTNLLFSFTRALSRSWKSGDRIVCTRLDHDANVSPWLLAARDVGASVEFLDVDPVDGTLDVDPLESLCADGRTRWVAISGASNLTGHAPDLARAIAIAHGAGARVLVDAVARVPHLPTDVTALDVDALTTSPYKWYGPHAGALIARHDLLREVEPYRVRPADYDGPPRWETGTPQVEVLAGIAAAAEYMMEGDPAAEAARENRLLGLMQDGLTELPGVRVHGPAVTPDRAPTLVFTVDGRQSSEVDAYLASQRIAVWSGDNYAVGLVDAWGLRAQGGVVRAGVVRYTTEDDISALVDAVRRLVA